jgi:hypothetical protein
MTRSPASNLRFVNRGFNHCSSLVIWLNFTKAFVKVVQFNKLSRRTAVNIIRWKQYHRPSVRGLDKLHKYRFLKNYPNFSKFIKVILGIIPRHILKIFKKIIVCLTLHFFYWYNYYILNVFSFITECRRTILFKQRTR